jgi:hypothetical protein
MLIDGKQLRDILALSQKAIELRNEHGRCCQVLTKDQALALDLDLYRHWKPSPHSISTASNPGLRD